MSENIAFCKQNIRVIEKGTRVVTYPFVLVHCPVPTQEPVKGIVLFLAVLALSWCRQPFIEMNWGFLDQWSGLDAFVSCSGVVGVFLECC